MSNAPYLGKPQWKPDPNGVWAVWHGITLVAAHSGSWATLDVDTDYCVTSKEQTHGKDIVEAQQRATAAAMTEILRLKHNQPVKHEKAGT